MSEHHPQAGAERSERTGGTVYYEVQTQPRGDRWGFTIRSSSGRDTWTSPWVDGGDTSDDAAAEGMRQARNLAHSGCDAR